MDNLENGISTMAECEGCQKKFELNRNTVIFKKEFRSKEGQSIFLTYYDCPYCGRRHYVQIDDSESKEILSKATKQMCDLMAKRSKNKSCEKQSVQFSKTRTHLSEVRMELMKQYQDQEVFAENGSSFVLRFSI